MVVDHISPAKLRVRSVNLDTGRENVAIISRRSRALRPEIFQGFSRIEVRGTTRSLLATLLITEDDELVGPDEIGLAEPAYHRFGVSVSEWVMVAPALPPMSLESIKEKIHGATLSAAQLARIVDDLKSHRYSDMEIAAFLVSCASFMTTGELIALTQSMAETGTQLKWKRPLVVDKHCIGGIPGNRTSMIVVPIVAAHGLLIPKTSSRAITSPAGTADTMEVLANVDLSTEHMTEVVNACNGCIVWGGHVNLSPADDVLISVERPLGIDTPEQMVASIMSKKIAAGSTHLLIDLPVGPSSKLTNDSQAMRLRKLFEYVSQYFGIVVDVVVSDGRQPIGKGIGPVLEAKDVMAVLENQTEAPSDLREKALQLAGRMLENDPGLRGGAGYHRARELLDSGAALNRMHRIIAAQGAPTCSSDLASLRADVLSPFDGVVASIDCLRINRLARLAGAPLYKGAGIRIHKKIGDRVDKGEPIYTTYSADSSQRHLTMAESQNESGYTISSSEKLGS